jgi:hypothetical protein
LIILVGAPDAIGRLPGLQAVTHEPLDREMYRGAPVTSSGRE